MPNVPILDLGDEIDAHWQEFTEAIAEVLKSQQFINGPAVTKFERDIETYLGTGHAVGLNSGTDAITIGLRALGVGPGDEVITSAFSFFATAEGIHLLGAKPVFVDIDPDTYNMDPNLVERAMTPKTRALIPVHLFGQAAPMDEIMEIARRHRLFILEDSAQAFSGEYRGRPLGTLGDVGAYSFFPSKNLGAFGDAGMAVTQTLELAERVRMLRAHGSKKKYHNEMIGFNSRLDSIQAAILTVKLGYITAATAGRREAARRYNQLLEGTPGVFLPQVPSYSKHSFHQYTIRIEGKDRNTVQERMREQGVETMVYYPVPLHKLPLYAGATWSFPHSEKAAREVLSLPIWPTITPAAQERVRSALQKALS